MHKKLHVPPFGGIMWDFVCILYSYVYAACSQVSTDVVANQKKNHGNSMPVRRSPDKV